MVKVLKTLKNSTCALLLCLLLSACGSDPDNAPPAPEQSYETQTPADVTAEAQAETVTEPEPEPEIINLSSELLDDIVDEGLDGSINPREQLLPDLFEPTEADRKTKLRGGLLLKNEPEQIQDMLEGVEVQIEIPTG